MTNSFSIPVSELGSYDVVVCGGGVAGCAAAVTAARHGAKTLLAESGGEPGGDITKGGVPQLLDPTGKGGFVKEINDFLNEGGHTATRRGPRFDENGKRLPGTLIEPEYLKYFLDRSLRDAGVDVAYYTMVAGVDLQDGRIARLLLCTEAGNFTVSPKIVIDATGNGLTAAMAGCDYEFGHPVTGHPQPTSIGLGVMGVGDDPPRTDTEEQKNALKAMAEAAGVHVTSNQVGLIPMATDGLWGLSFNFQYDVPHDDILGLSRATMNGRIECIEGTEKLRTLPGLDGLRAVSTSSHIGIREGKRIKGVYQLTLDDILEGRRFDDGICLVRFGIDVHALADGDARATNHGMHTKPYNIPYRCLLPLGCDNLLLAGRCISGDFYAHASYRVACDVIPTGEAAGYAAACCVRDGCLPKEANSAAVRGFMAERGYEL